MRRNLRPTGRRLVIRIRLYALPEDNAAALTRLAELFEVLDDSGDRAPRGGGALRFRYLTVRIPTDPRGPAAPTATE
jgi:hypothetical protein